MQLSDANLTAADGFRIPTSRFPPSPGSPSAPTLIIDRACQNTQGAESASNRAGILQRGPQTAHAPSLPRSMDAGAMSSPEKHVSNGTNGASPEAPPGEIAHTSLSKLLRALSSGRRGNGDLDPIRASCESVISSLSAPQSPAGAAGAASAPPKLGIEVALPFLQALTTQNARVIEEALEGLHEILAHGLIRWDVDFPSDSEPKQVDDKTEPPQQVVLPPNRADYKGIS